ncbi:hypothetical protein COW36_24915 [bacterium (Candidatus Blackallbacteria) CG17_big_fil_post_rev_8_21_14_2_50_48_46]|uniref:Uncharacterized protein n=1 Tax=bacterium (Candidatus Blackallbacteria) CG17_big_fil_post_rev_8_21_14_2_50_48_46 TaxID=2014261 RepID=A0A2M7FWP2_9BACT|nr:MAG: hypothetical protein COW64_07920 [bacterium (Candidatus Blackallbacteria) CG18_big_fil_WC_8_21_14_2_50_49_26]PIW13646.1 MAG: hypothetical protein COW36_24915 [bacterium (Candidatus Blackallbacteria) CG17_big_fil_post_rev_8_21_14_2_50_48_46]PIW49169.1 MAG: hypothetical protein COW20_06745 [bacterium (Candidatus Blackallbacteria) CG13_big_fil_rev_8_21_14_2_50_49_14]
MKKMSLSHLSTLVIIVLSSGTLILPSIASNSDEPEVSQVFIETAENSGVYGDSILVVYDQPMLVDAQPIPLAGGMEDANNAPGSELEAPAEYPNHHGNATASKTARNYRVKITPGPYSNTTAFDGTWADLGGKAYYHPEDSDKRMIILKPPSKQSKLFAPGDRVEISVAETVKSPRKKRMRANKNKRKEIAS